MRAFQLFGQLERMPPVQGGIAFRAGPQWGSMRHLFCGALAAVVLLTVGCTDYGSGKVTEEPAGETVSETATPVSTTEQREEARGEEGRAPAGETAGGAESLLSSLEVRPESGSSYERSHYEHSSRHLCSGAGRDPYTGLAFDSGTCDVDHIVAAKEAHESGGASWGVSRRREFGNYANNLVASRDCVNRSKGSRDIAEWSKVGSGKCAGAQLSASGVCFWAIRTIEVKSAFGLSVDSRERDALESALNGCTSGERSGDLPIVSRSERSEDGGAMTKNGDKSCTHDGRGHGHLGYNPGTHTHPGADHGPHASGKCAGI